MEMQISMGDAERMSVIKSQHLQNFLEDTEFFDSAKENLTKLKQKPNIEVFTKAKKNDLKKKRNAMLITSWR